MPLAEWGSCVPGSPGVPVTQCVRADAVASSAVILGVLDHLRVKLPLGVVREGPKPAPEVCSGNSFRQEGTCATGWVGFLHPWIQLVLIPSSVGADVVSSSPLIL